MQVSVCLGAILIPEYLDLSGYSAPRNRIAGINSGIYSGIYSYSGISQTNAPQVSYVLCTPHMLASSKLACSSRE